MKSRIIVLIVSFFFFLNSVAFMIIGGIRAYQGYEAILDMLSGDQSTRAGIYIAKSVDTFLISMVAFVIAAGVMKVFYLHHVPDEKFPKWLRINSFKDLKILLWEATLLTMVVFFLSVVAVVADTGTFEWSLLGIPISILLLAISLSFVRGDLVRK